MLFLIFSKKFFIIFVVLVSGVFGSFYFVRTHLAVSIDYQKEGVPSNSEWSVSFGQDVFIPSARMVPEIKGRWYAHKGIFGSSVVGFIPESGFEKGRKYTATIAYARTYEKTKLITTEPMVFSVAPAPGIVSLDVDSDKKNVSVLPDIKLVTTKEFSKKKFSIVVKGYDGVFAQISREGDSAVWRPTTELHQGQNYTLQIYDENMNLLIEHDFETVREPKLATFIADEHIIPGSKITIAFDTVMKNASSSLIYSDMLGSGIWVDSKTYEYIVGDISPNETYTITIPRGLVSGDGGKITNDIVHKLSSPGYIIPTFSGVSRESGLNDPIEISFNHPVDKESAERAFRISPQAKGKLSWKEERLVFTPTKLLNQQKYTVSMSAGIKAKFGLPSKSKSSVSFSTVPEVYKLKVPYFAQEYSRSCEAASLRMALAYHGVYVNDMDILEKVGYDPRPKDNINNTWDDPRVMFVGHASSDDGEGYGVYGEPIARVAEDFGRSAVYTRSITPQSLAKNIKDGNPVVLWGYTSLSVPKTKWFVAGGDEVTALPGEHARVVVGVYGSASNPIGFYLHDPRNGKRYEYWGADDLMKHFTRIPGVTDQAVVVG